MEAGYLEKLRLTVKCAETGASDPYAEPIFKRSNVFVVMPEPADVHFTFSGSEPICNMVSDFGDAQLCRTYFQIHLHESG